MGEEIPSEESEMGKTRIGGKATRKRLKVFPNTRQQARGMQDKVTKNKDDKETRLRRLPV